MISKFASIAVVAWGMTGVCVSTSLAQESPNILLVVADDMGWTDLGCFGSEIETPNIDALAEQGVKFNKHYVSISCSPTRSMLLSGTDNHIAGLGNMGELLTENQKGQPGHEGYLNDRVASLAEVLKANGYHTYMAGKWHLGHEDGQFPFHRGFDRSLSMLDGASSFWSDMFGALAGHPKANYVEDDRRLEELPRDFYATRNFTDFLIDAIRANRGDGKPFLAYLAFNTPHDPMHVPEPWLSKHRGDYDEGYEVLKTQRAEAAREIGLVPEDAPMPEMFKDVKAWDSLSDEEKAISARGMEAYAGMVANMDYHYGRVVGFLKDIDEYENTLVIFMSDNGSNPWFAEDYPGNKGSEWFAQFDNSLENIGHPMSHYAYGLGWGSASTGPLDLFKLTVAEGGIRSPLMIAGPGVEGGRETAAFTYVWDIMPTILEAAGIEHPKEFEGREVEPMRGRSLHGILSGAEEAVYTSTDMIGGELSGGRWVRQGDLKAVSVIAPYGDGSWKLFDLAVDPGETRNLAEERPEDLERLVDGWEAYAEEVGVVLPE